MVGEGVRSGSSPGERKGRHARPGKTRNEQLIDRAWENSCQRARTRTAHATSTRSNRISRDRQYASLCHQTVFVEIVRTRAVCREQTVNGEKRPNPVTRILRCNFRLGCRVRGQSRRDARPFSVVLDARPASPPGLKPRPDPVLDSGLFERAWLHHVQSGARFRRGIGSCVTGQRRIQQR